MSSFVSKIRECLMSMKGYYEYIEETEIDKKDLAVYQLNLRK